ncbi:serine/threonine-protein kinase OSR1-like [Sycon ciliatum]|uniref:serine/threonine-protein kinase OSR1-like n=1 Tax=Sycon ciliatum TaxID=27933 RepID=UPI0031F5F914
MAAEENAVFTALGLNQAEVPYLGTLDVNETEDELGRGSFAVVYKSKWCGLKVAAKALHSILIDRRNQGRDVVLHDFGAEIARMARLRHPHLCPIFGVGMVGTTPAIVVELMSDTLETMSVGARRQDLLQLMRYIEHTAAGLRYLHSIPMVHRDLKPSNVLVANSVAKITDFGVSKLLPSVADQFREAAQSMTRQPGTPLFMPPEALQETESGRARYDLSLDVFSFGVTAMSVLSGVMPSIELMFAARSRQAADGSHVAIPELERRRADFARIPDGHPLKDLLRRCLADPPARRPDAEEIHEFVQGVVQFFSSLPQPRPPTVQPAVVRRLDSISEQLTQQATSVTALSARSDTLEEPATNNQTTTPEQLTATRQQLTAAQQQQLAATHEEVTQQAEPSVAASTTKSAAVVLMVVIVLGALSYVLWTVLLSQANGTTVASSTQSAVDGRCHVFPFMHLPRQISKIKRSKKAKATTVASSSESVSGGTPRPISKTKPTEKAWRRTNVSLATHIYPSAHNVPMTGNLFPKRTRQTGTTSVNDLEFADDAALLAPSRESAQLALELFSNVASSFGLTLSTAKTKFMAVGANLSCADRLPLFVGPEEIESVKSFVYLGSVITADTRSSADVARRLGKAAAAFDLMRRVFLDRNLSIATKRHLYDVCVLSTLLYAY